MKTIAVFLIAQVLCGFSILAAQQKLTTEPDPSFAEDAVSNHRHPGRGHRRLPLHEPLAELDPLRRARRVHRARHPHPRRSAPPAQRRAPC